MKADIIISETKSIKRRIDILENDVEMNNINEEAILKKDPNREIAYKTIKSINNESPKNNNSLFILSISSSCFLHIFNKFIIVKIRIFFIKYYFQVFN